MKKLEEKIMEKVFCWETKKTLLIFSLEFVGILSLALAVIVLGEVIIEVLTEQKTLDLLTLFGEDFEVIKRYFWDTIFVFYTEMPKILLILILFSFSVLIFLLLTVIRNFKKIKNKIISLINFWIKK